MKHFKKMIVFVLLFLLFATPSSVLASCKEPKRGPPGPQGPVGPQGPAGPGPFIVDTGSLLTFTIYNEPGGQLPAGSQLIPFVSTPDGRVIQGAPIIANGVAFDYTFAPIPVPNPVFGTYHTGVSITVSAPFFPALMSLTSLATSDRAGVSPPENTLVGEMDGLSPVFIVPLAAGDKYQTTADFTYGPADIP